MAHGNQLYINNEWLPYCDLEVDFENNEDIQKNEAGQDVIVSISRLQKRTFNCNCKCSPTWAGKILGWGALSTVTFSYGGTTPTFSGRLRVNKLKPVRYIEDTLTAEISFTLTEI